MTFDISGIFVIALAVTGAILTWDAVVRRRRGRNGRQPGLPGALVSQSRSWFPVILVVLVIRSFVLEPFRIPSASMMPGLVDGDFIFVNKFSYGLRLPLTNWKFLSIGAPQRGDVIVFRLPSDPSVHFIKRLVGLPGDHVVVSGNRLTINGQSIPLQAAGVFAGGFGFDGSILGWERLGSAPHEIMFASGRSATDFDAMVPPGTYFFMGDNRNDSEDSRFTAVGFVPEQNLVGHAMRIWMNWRIPGWPNWHRIGMRVL
jgi:signal peptidase I